MKIVLLGHEDIASVTALDTLVRNMPEHKFIGFWSGPSSASDTGHRELGELDELETRLFAEYICQAHTATELKQARRLANPNSSDGLQALRNAAPDLVVSIRYRRILRDEAIAVPRLGVLNLHSGILPDYRGVMATFWAMLRGESEIGATLHRIVDAGIDTGPIIEVTHRAVDYERSYLANVLALYDDGCRSVVNTIQKIAQGGEISAASQPSAAGRYFSVPTPNDVDEFLRKGLQLKDDADFML